jgi:CxxC motif-containing protein
VTGNHCKEGRDYVIAEYRAPVGVFTSTVLAERSGRLLPIKTDKLVHKNQLKGVIQACAKPKVETPIKIGQVIIPNIMGTGANQIATGNL